MRVLADNKAPVPVPDSAEDVEFDGADGTLEYTSASPLQNVAEFYRTAMKEQGWAPQSSVINNANMVVLNFAKAGKSVSFTIMRMGNTTKVSGEGSALKVGGAKAAAAPRVRRRCRRAPRISKRRRAAVCRFPSATP